jgi:hypothetical protein
MLGRPRSTRDKAPGDATGKKNPADDKDPTGDKDPMRTQPRNLAGPRANPRGQTAQVSLKEHQSSGPAGLAVVRIGGGDEKGASVDHGEPLRNLNGRHERNKPLNGRPIRDDSARRLLQSKRLPSAQGF